MTAPADLDADAHWPDDVPATTAELRSVDPLDDEPTDDLTDGEMAGDVPDLDPEGAPDSGEVYGRNELAGLDDDPDREATSTCALFEGDEGALDVQQRKALVVLLKQRFISARTHPKEWAALIANLRPIRSRLNDLFMELQLDLRSEVAYKRQASPEGGGRPFPTLLYDAPCGREETIVLVYLRSRHRKDQAAGVDRSFVDRSEILDYIAQHRPSHATDVSGDARKAHKAVEQIYKTGLLLGKSTAERFEISGAIEVLLPMAKLTELLAWLRAQNTAGPGTVPDASAPGLLGGQVAAGNQAPAAPHGDCDDRNPDDGDPDGSEL